MTRLDDLVWEPPGPGSWQLLADHYPRPVTQAMEPFAEIWSCETTGFLHRLGLPIERAEMAAVNGMPYVSILPAGGGGRKPPPDWLLPLLVRVVPTFRRAERSLRRVLADRPWVEGIAQWYDVDRAVAMDRMRSLARVDVGSLDDAQLAEHLLECERTVLEGSSQHMALHAHDGAPPGLFAAMALDWGLDLVTATDLLAGASPASRGQSDELQALRAVVAGRPVKSLDDIRALGPDAAQALDEFIEVHGCRLVDGYDIDCVTLAEVPSVVVALVTSDGHDPDEAAFPQRRDAVRARVPAEHRDEFDRRLDDARLAYGVRDDNSGILFGWPAGLLRRAMLAAGDRLVGRGTLDDRLLAIEEQPARLAGALRSDVDLDAEDLRARALHRRTLTAAHAPRWLGGEDGPPPQNLPGALGLVFRALAVFGLGEAPDTEPLHGIGIGDEPYEGRARLVLGGSEGFDSFEPGDVLVAPMTSPSYNVVLSLAGAVVTEEGAVMSHAAIMARELGLPAVIGAPKATELIRDGDLVRVDPRACRVTVLAQAEAASAR